MLLALTLAKYILNLVHFYTENSKQIAINGRKNEVKHYEVSKIYEKSHGTAGRVQRNS